MTHNAYEVLPILGKLDAPMWPSWSVLLRNLEWLLDEVANIEWDSDIW